MGDSIQEFTNGIKALGQSGGLQLSQDEIAKTKAAISEFRSRLEIEKANIAKLHITGSPGKYESGTQTQTSLNDDIDALVNLIQSYIDYLNEFERTIDKAITPIVAAG